MLLTYSRNGALAVLIIIAFRLFRLADRRIAHPVLIFYIVLAIWILICYLYVEYFSGLNFVYKYREGFDRYSSIVDNSNYIRTYINTQVINNIGVKNLLFGFSDIEYLSIVDFEDKTAFPHNLFFSIYAQCGLFYSLSYVKRLCGIFYRKHSSTLFFVVLTFAMILGPSIYYGIDLLLVLSVSQMKENRVYAQEN